MESPQNIKKQTKNPSLNDRFFGAEAGGVEPHPVSTEPFVYQARAKSVWLQPPMPPQLNYIMKIVKQKNSTSISEDVV